MIDEYAHRYGKLPREVMAESFDDVIPFVYLWKERADFETRKQLIKMQYEGSNNNGT